MDLVDNAARDAVERLRRRGAIWWRGASATEGWTRADTVAHLVEEYAKAVAAVEGEDHGTPRRPSRDALLAEQLAVVSYDLVLALRAAPHPDEHRIVALTMLSETLLRLHDVDPRPLAEDAAGAVIAGLHAETELAEQVGSLGDLLLLLERRAGERDV